MVKRTCVVVLVMLLGVGLFSPRVVWAQDDPVTDESALTFDDALPLLRGRDWAAASDMLDKVVLNTPTDARAWYYLGLSLHTQGRINEALPAHLMAAESDAFKSNAAYNAACAYAIRNDADHAFKWLDRAINAGFQNMRLLHTDRDLVNIRSDERFERYLELMRENITIMPMKMQSHGAEAAPDPVADGTPLSKRPVRRQLDFWRGAWKVTSMAGAEQGNNHIHSLLNGNLLLENWTSINGSQGMSMNFFDPATKQWTQVWVDGRGEVILLAGNATDEGMRMTGRRVLPDGTTLPFRCSLSPRDDGTVHQLFEESKDGGTTWDIWFEGIYAPQEKPAPVLDEVTTE